MTCLHKGMCQLKKPNEITEPLAFRHSQYALHGEAKCYSHVPGAHVLAVVNKGQNERKKTYFHW